MPGSRKCKTDLELERNNNPRLSHAKVLSSDVHCLQAFKSGVRFFQNFRMEEEKRNEDIARLKRFVHLTFSKRTLPSSVRIHPDIVAHSEMACQYSHFLF